MLFTVSVSMLCLSIVQLFCCLFYACKTLTMFYRAQRQSGIPQIEDRKAIKSNNIWVSHVTFAIRPSLHLQPQPSSYRLWFLKRFRTHWKLVEKMRTMQNNGTSPLLYTGLTKLIYIYISNKKSSALQKTTKNNGPKQLSLLKRYQTISVCYNGLNKFKQFLKLWIETTKQT